MEQIIQELNLKCKQYERRIGDISVQMNLKCKQYEKRITDINMKCKEYERLINSKNDGIGCRKCKAYEIKIKEINSKNDAVICKLISDMEVLKEKLAEKIKLIHNWAEHAKIARRRGVTKECKYFKEVMHYFQQGLSMIDLSSAVNEKVSKIYSEKFNNEITELRNQLMNANFLVDQQQFKILNLEQHQCPKPEKPKKEIKKEIVSNMLPLTPESFTTGDSVGSVDSVCQSRLNFTTIKETPHTKQGKEKTSMNLSKSQELILNCNGVKIQTEHIKDTQEESCISLKCDDGDGELGGHMACYSPGIDVGLISSDEDSSDEKEDLAEISLKTNDHKGQFDLSIADTSLCLDRGYLASTQQDFYKQPIGNISNSNSDLNYQIGSPGMPPNSDDVFDVIKHLRCPSPVSWDDWDLLPNTKPKIAFNLMEINASELLVENKQTDKTKLLHLDQFPSHNISKGVNNALPGEFNKVSCTLPGANNKVSNLPSVIDSNSTGITNLEHQPMFTESFCSLNMLNATTDHSSVVHSPQIGKSLSQNTSPNSRSIFESNDTANICLLPSHLEDHDYCTVSELKSFTKSSDNWHSSLSINQRLSPFISNETTDSSFAINYTGQDNHPRSPKPNMCSERQNTLTQFQKSLPQTHNSISSVIEHPSQDFKSSNEILSVVEQSSLLIPASMSLNLNVKDSGTKVNAISNVDDIYGNAQAMPGKYALPSTITNNIQLTDSPLIRETVEFNSLTVEQSPQSIERDSSTHSLDINCLNKLECTVIDPILKETIIYSNDTISISRLLKVASSPSYQTCVAIQEDENILSEEGFGLESISHSNSLLSPINNCLQKASGENESTESVWDETSSLKSCTSSNTCLSYIQNNLKEASETKDTMDIVQDEGPSTKSYSDSSICLFPGESDSTNHSLPIEKTLLSSEDDHITYNLDIDFASKDECTLVDPLIEEHNSSLINHCSIVQMLKNQSEFFCDTMPSELKSLNYNSAHEGSTVQKEDYHEDHNEAIVNAESDKYPIINNNECQIYKHNITDNEFSVSCSTNRTEDCSSSSCTNIDNSKRSPSIEALMNVEVNDCSHYVRSWEQLNGSQYSGEEPKRSHTNTDSKFYNILKQITNTSVPEYNVKKEDLSSEYQEQLYRQSSKMEGYEGIFNSYIVPKFDPLPDAMYKYKENLIKTNVDFTNHNMDTSCLLDSTLDNSSTALDQTVRSSFSLDKKAPLKNSIDVMENNNCVTRKKRIAHPPLQKPMIVVSTPLKEMEAIDNTSKSSLADQKLAYVKCDRDGSVKSERKTNCKLRLSSTKPTDDTSIKRKNVNIENRKKERLSPTFTEVEQIAPELRKKAFVKDKIRISHDCLLTSPTQTYSVLKHMRNIETKKRAMSQTSPIEISKLSTMLNKTETDFTNSKETKPATFENRIACETLADTEASISKFEKMQYDKDKNHIAYQHSISKSKTFNEPNQIKEINARRKVSSIFSIESVKESTVMTNTKDKNVCRIKETKTVNENCSNKEPSQTSSECNQTNPVNKMRQTRTVKSRKRMPTQYSPVPKKKLSALLNKETNAKTCSSKEQKSTNIEKRLPYNTLPGMKQITPVFQLKELKNILDEKTISSQSSLDIRSQILSESKQTKNANTIKNKTSLFSTVPKEDMSTVLNNEVDSHCLSLSVGPKLTTKEENVSDEIKTDSLPICRADQLYANDSDTRKTLQYYEIIKLEPTSEFHKINTDEMTLSTRHTQLPQIPGPLDQINTDSSNFIPKFYCEHTDGNPDIESATCKVESILEKSEGNVKIQLPMLNRYKQKTLSEIIPQGEKLDVRGNILRAVVDKHSRDINLYKSRNISENRKYIQVQPGKADKKIADVWLTFFHGGMTNMDSLKTTANHLNSYSCTKLLMGLLKAVNQEYEQCLNSQISYEDKSKSLWILDIINQRELSNPKAPKLYPVVFAVIVLIMNVRENKCRTSESLSGFMVEALTFLESTLMNTNGFDLCDDKTIIIFISQLYTGLARLSGQLIRARRFIYDMLYCFVRRSILVSYNILLCWPDVLPPHKSGFYGDPLAMSVINSLMAGGHTMLANLVSSYCYKYSLVNPDVLFGLCVDNLCMEGVFEALFLICKRASDKNWFLKKPMPVLMDLVKQWQTGNTPDNVAVTAIRLLSSATRSLNPAESQFVLDPLFNLFKEILFDPKTPHWMAEVVAFNVCCLARLNWFVCTDIISEWKPKQISLDVIDQILLNIIGRHNWKKNSFQVYLRK